MKLKVRGILTYFGLFLLCTVIAPTLIVFIGSIVAGLSIDGFFECWKPLYSPNTTITTILDASYDTVWVGTTGQHIFYATAECKEKAKCWELTNSVPNDLESYSSIFVYSYEAIKGDSCKFHNSRFSPAKVPGDIDQCVLVPFSGMEWGGETYFALLGDGTVWRWSHTNYSVGGLPAPFVFLFMAVFPACIIIGAIIFIVLLVWRLIRKPKTAQTLAEQTTG